MSDTKAAVEVLKNGEDTNQEVTVKAFSSVKLLKKSRNEGSYSLIDGQAEVAGAPLLQDVEYKLQGRNVILVFSWKGCVLKVSSTVSVEHSDYCPFSLVLKNHALIEVERQKASVNGDRGPSVMVVGEYDTGKTTAVTCLLNYAVRMGRTPVFVSLDVRHGDLGVPGSLGAVVVDKMSDDTGRFLDFKEPPLMYHFGHAYIEVHLSLYVSLIENLGKDVLAAVERNPSVKTSGIVLDTNGDCSNLKVITKAAEAFEVSHVIVIDNERLYNDVVREMPPFVIVSYVPKLPGAFQRDRIALCDDADMKVGRYFGMPKKTDRKDPTDESTATTITMSFDDVKVLDVPSDKRSRSSELRIKSLGIKDDLDKHLLGVSTATSKDDAPLANVYGYAAVARTERSKNEIKFTVPSGTVLPGAYLLKTDGTLPENED